jgi:hypothetical protein
LLAYTVFGAVLFSLLEPTWGANSATLVTAISFWVALIMLTSLEIGMTAAHERVRYKVNSGRAVFSFATLVFAGLCVAGSRAIAFVPGYLYGVLISYETDTELTEKDQADIARSIAGAVLAVAVLAWFALAAFEDAFGSSGLGSLPTAIAAGLFMAGVESLLIGLLPLRLLPGAVLRRHHPIVWKMLWAASGFLFALALLRPGLASAHGRSTWWILGGAAIYGTVAVAFWWITTRRGRPASREDTTPLVRPEAALAATAPPPGGAIGTPSD